MTYLFSNPQVKKWKTLFVLSFCLNLILLAVIIIGSRNESKEEAAAQLEAAAAEQQEAEGIGAEQTETQAEPEEQPVSPTEPGELIASSVTIEDNFFNAFNSSKDIARFSKSTGISNLSDILSAHTGRLLIWDLVLRNDVRKGDKLDFVFRAIPDEEKRTRNDLPDMIEVIALRYYSQKFGKEIKIYQYAASNSLPKYYYDDGIMIEKVISPYPPIKSYIQITSTIGDRAPKHEGVDFKTPVGTPVYATIDGTVTRVNWKTRYNGDCIEIEGKKTPYVFKYLHLSEVDVKVGQKVSVGQQIALSGNTGKSTAPHLHYQINVGTKGKVLDPMKYHKTVIDKIPDSEKTNFRNRTAELDSLMK